MFTRLDSDRNAKIMKKAVVEEKLDPGSYKVSEMGLDVRKPVFGDLRTTKGADQAAHTRSLISAFVFRFLESIISRLATSETLFF